MEYTIQIKLFGKEGYLETVAMDLGTYYDGDDYDELIAPENIVKKGIIRAEAVQYDTDGKPYSAWRLDFDENGNMARTTELDAGSMDL